MQIALPIGLPLDKNKVSIGVLLLAGITIIPMNGQEAGSIQLDIKKRPEFQVSEGVQISPERDFIPSMLVTSGGSEALGGVDSNSVPQDLVADAEAKKGYSDQNDLEKQKLRIEQSNRSVELARGTSAAVLSEKIVDTAKAWLGVPYFYGGATFAGVDCSALMQKIYQELGIELPRTSQEQFRMGVGVPRSQLRAGDLVFFSTSGPGASHVGIYIGNQEFVSATRNYVEIQSLDQDYWNRTYRGSRRVIP